MPNAANDASSSSTAGCSGIAVRPADDRTIQSILNHQPAGATFCFAPGIYRFAKPIVPKTGQQLIAAGHGTILTGAKIVGAFTRSGGAYRASGFLQGAQPSSTNCLIPDSLCNTAQDVFLDGKPLVRANSLAHLTSGTFYEDFAANRIWLHDDPAGHLVEQAYAPALVASNRGGITVQGFVVEMAASPAQHGALLALGYRGKGWRIVGNEVRYNHGAGITSAPLDEAQGGSLIEGNDIRDNGQEGIGAVGNGLIVTENEIAFNNRVNYSCGWECGGAKFAGPPGDETENLTVTGNDVHDNMGPGFWCDVNSYNVTFERNHIANNRQTTPGTGYQTGSGIFLEISDRALVAGNVLSDNGPVANSVSQATFYQGGQILISATANVTVRDNTASGAVGIGMLQQDRSDSCEFGATLSSTYPDGTPVCPYHYHYCTKKGVCTDNFMHQVHDIAISKNRIAETARSGNADVAGLDSDLGDDAPIFAPSSGIVYSDNTYTLQDLAGYYFDWKNAVTKRGPWLAAGQDQGSTFR